ncbi:MAG: DUF4129 domain-containing protein [Acidimicrobiia bacterium]
MHDGGLARAVVAAGGLLVALVLVVVAISDPPAGLADIGDPGWVADVMMGSVAVTAIVGAIVIPVALVLAAGGPTGPNKKLRTTKSWLVRAIGPLVPLLIIFVLVAWMRQSGNRVPLADTIFGSSDVASESDGTGEERRARPTNWAVVGLTAAGLAVLGTAAVIAIRRDGPAPPPEPEEGWERVSLAEAAQASIEVLEEEPDHRKAVIAAYARMEQLFGAAGLPRRPAETAREHVDRALDRLGAPADVVAVLAQRFEEARFSTRPIGPDARAAAVDALTRLRDEMQPEVTTVTG